MTTTRENTNNHVADIAGLNDWLAIPKYTAGNYELIEDTNGNWLNKKDVIEIFKYIHNLNGIAIRKLVDRLVNYLESQS